MLDYQIIILHYQGIHLLQKCLPSILEAIKFSRFKGSVTVLDNGSQDGSEEYIRQIHPEVRYARSLSNKVLCSYNDYVKDVIEPYIILLNNDIRVDKGFVDPLLNELDANSKLFFASPHSTLLDSGQYEGSLSTLEMKWGLPWGTTLFSGYTDKIQSVRQSMQTGFGAFRTSYFKQLEGYDDLYLPGTIEDTDICFRAYRQGWSGVYCPDSRVEHIGQASFSKAFGSSGLKRINRRNMYLFVWKNIRDFRYWIQHLIFLPLQLFKYLVKGEFSFVLGLWDAIQMLPNAIYKRKRLSKHTIQRSDNEIFELSRNIIKAK